MSRSRHPRKRRPNQRTDEERFPERYLRVPDPPGLGELREALAIAEVLDGALEVIDVPDGDYSSRDAGILAVVDAKTRHHRRPRRRRKHTIRDIVGRITRGSTNGGLGSPLPPGPLRLLFDAFMSLGPEFTAKCVARYWTTPSP